MDGESSEYEGIVHYDLDLGQAADRFLADATQAVATAELGGKLKLEQIVPIFWDQELDRLTARDTGEEMTQLRLTFVGDDWDGYAAHVHVMDGRIQVSRALIARASESRHRLCLNGRHPQDDREYFRELVLQAATRSLHAAASV